VSGEAKGVRKTIMKKLLCSALGGLLLTVSCSVEGQSQAKVPKIGWLGARTPSGPGGGPGTGAESFRREFSKLGYVEGKNIAIEYRYADDQLDRLPGLVDQLVRLKIDLLIAPTTLEARAAKNATRTIPIVFLNVPDPVASGLVDSLARPGGNITGFTTINAVLAGKRLELLKEIIPNLSRIAVLWDPQNPAAAQQWKESQQPARELGLQLHSMEVSSADKYAGAFREALKSHSAALVVSQGSLVASNQKQVVDLAAKNQLPAIYTQGNYVASGGLMSYGPDRTEPFRRAAVYVDKILKGAKPADLPVEQPKKFEFIVNLKAAKQIGLTIPPNVLARADRVIK
jgi:putative tryptophan/tyrosine transport system substrate-binding protein